LLAVFPEIDRAIAPPISMHPKNATWRLAIDVRLRTNDLESCLQAVERMPSERRGRPVQFIPYRFELANKIDKNDKLSLAFDALVLSEAVGCEVTRLINARSTAPFDPDQCRIGECSLKERNVAFYWINPVSACRTAGALGCHR
jgi:hypothetical protein